MATQHTVMYIMYVPWSVSTTVPYSMFKFKCFVCLYDIVVRLCDSPLRHKKLICWYPTLTPGNVKRGFTDFYSIGTDGSRTTRRGVIAIRKHPSASKLIHIEFWPPAAWEMRASYWYKVQIQNNPHHRSHILILYPGTVIYTVSLCGL